MRQTKIVATIGPASRDPETVRELIDAGVDVFRMNFAHGSPEDHASAARLVRKQARDAGRAVGLLADLPGPKMRTGSIAGDEATIHAGDELVLTPENVQGDSKRIPTTVADLASLVDSEQDIIFLADGEIVLSVKDVRGQDVVTKVIRGGVVRTGKGMHLPGAERRMTCPTEDDKRALRSAVDIDVDFVGISFVRDGADVGSVRGLLSDRERSRVKLIAKIETRHAVDHLDEIVHEADAVMVARGDLGIQTPLTRVPLVQKEIIKSCNRVGVPVITATQMLESMTDSPLPTRAEITDIANAVVDGTDALMLSEETAVGEYPVAAVETMAETAIAAEAWPTAGEQPSVDELTDDPVSWAVAHAGAQAAADLEVAAILCPTRSGSTVRRVAAFRPRVPVIALAQQPEVAGWTALLRGVIPLVAPDQGEPTGTSEDINRATAQAEEANLVKAGDLVVVVAGSPGPRAGRTDYVRVVRI
jgi:pyruvate kinase